MNRRITEFATTKAEQVKVANAIHKAIESSMVKHSMRHLTKTEVQRRFDICVDWFCRLREKNFTSERAASEMARALDCELSNVPYEIPTSALWVPQAAW